MISPQQFTNMGFGGQPPNIFQQAAGGVQAAGMGTMNEMGFQPTQLATTDLQPYMNPYTNEVIGNTQADIERQRLIAQNQIGAQAGAAGAFGGSRHGVESALTNEAALRQMGQTSAALRQTGYGQAQSAAQQDIANQMQASQMRLGAAGQLGNIANLGFGMGQELNQGLAQQGMQQQALQQALIDAARQQYAGYANAPGGSLSYMAQALGSTPVPQTQTTSSNPGLFGLLSAGASIASLFPTSDERLKENIQKIGESGGVNWYRWDWTEKGKEIAGDQITVGVLAQEVMQTYPDAVVMADDGYYRVNYARLP